LNAFQKFLSYLFPVLIERVQGELDHELSVYLHRGTLKLYSDKTNYSFGQLHKVFQRALKDFDFKEKANSRILVLGFGVGSIASILRSELKVKAPMVGVEKDAMILEMYHSYFSKGYTDLRVIQQDALEYVKKDSEQFDLVFVDLFVDHAIPDFCYDEQFLENLSRILSTSGTLLFNTISPSLSISSFENGLSRSFIIQSKKQIFGDNCVYFLKKRKTS